MHTSVVIPTYNYGHFLGECLESVLNQTVLPEEIVVVDDGSTDSTAEVVQEYLSSPLVTFIRIENSGVSAARNRGIAASTGDVVGFLDADDKWRGDKLERQLPLFENPEVGVVYSLSAPFGEKGPIVDYRRARPQRGQVLEALMSNNIVPLSSALVRRRCLARVGAFNEEYGICADLDLWLRMALGSIEFDYVNEPLVMYRVHPSSMLSDVRWKYRENAAILREVFDGPRGGLCSVEMKRSAWAFFFAKCSYGYLERGKRPRALVNAFRSIYHRPFGVLGGMAWRVVANSLLPRALVRLLKRRRRVQGETKSLRG